ncbi:MAG TPA: hypothetical protein VMT95_08990 [Candidatus Binatia bacterium]|nr:hypothetical protein [Candidatus Binatia bacterium]
MRLSRSPATAYEHLHSEECERENAQLRAKLRELGVATQRVKDFFWTNRHCV